MKEKTSLTLSPDVLAGIDRLAGSKLSRSAVIETVLRRYLKEQERTRRDAREVELLNRAAEELGAEVLETLEFQAPWD